MKIVTKEQVQALKKLLGNTDIQVPIGKSTARVSVGALCDAALRSISKEKAPERKFRFVNAGEVTVWQKQVCLESGLAPAGGGARLVWVANADAIDLGIEVKKQENL